MKTRSIILSFLLFSILFYQGCNRKTKIAEERLDSLKIKYKLLQAAMDTSWNRMIGEDDRKIRYLKRLLNEISFTNNYDSLKYAGLMKELNDLKKSRYDQTSMSNSSLIDLYDSLTIALVPKIERFALDHPQYENYPLMAELISSIDSLDNNVLFKRNDYDKCVDNYNEFVTSNTGILKEIFRDDDFNKKPVFRLLPD